MNPKCACGGETIIRGRKLNRVKYQCKKCGKYKNIASTRSARILLVDIETLYMEVRGVWDLKTEYIRPDRIVKDWSILCYAAKWLFEPEILGQAVTAKEAVNRTEKSIIGGIWELMEEADVVVWQNGNNFDAPRLNSKFLKHGYPPPSRYLTVDTLASMKSKIYLPSYSLDYVSKNILGLEGKIKMSIEDWDECAEGNQAAIDRMLEYCKKDVAPLLEDLYLYLLPWIPNHPNLGVYSLEDRDVCPRCESTDLRWNTKSYATPQGLWESFRCANCGSTGRGSKKLHRVKSVSIKPT